MFRFHFGSSSLPSTWCSASRNRLPADYAGLRAGPQVLVVNGLVKCLFAAIETPQPDSAIGLEKRGKIDDWYCFLDSITLLLLL